VTSYHRKERINWQNWF